MEQLFQQTDTCDAKLISSDYKEFRVHKAVAAVASDKLRLHFFHVHPESTCYKTNCNSKALVRVVNFMCKGWEGMSVDSFEKFCRLHPGTNTDAVNDWLNIVIDMFLVAKELKMFNFVDSIIHWCHDFLKQEPTFADIIIDTMHDKSKNKEDLKDFELLTRCFHWLSLKKESSNAGDNGYQPMTEDVLEAKSILLLLAAQKNDINGLYLLATETNGENDDHIKTHHQQSGKFVFREKRRKGSESVVGFLHSEKQINGNESIINVCKWNSEVHHPTWKNEDHERVGHNPAVLRIK